MDAAASPTNDADAIGTGKHEYPETADPDTCLELPPPSHHVSKCIFQRHVWNLLTVCETWYLNQRRVQACQTYAARWRFMGGYTGVAGEFLQR